MNRRDSISFTADRRYIVTGASSGIGESVALLLNELGASVIGIGRNVDRLNSLKGKCLYPENLHVEVRDLSVDVQSLPAYVKELKGKYGKFSGMAFCAGIGCVMPVQALEYDAAEKIFQTNYFAPLFMVKGLVDRRNNVGIGTSIVLISSIDSICSTKGQCLYSGSKAALAASMKAISREVSSFGVRINTLHPSMIKTPMTVGSNSNALDISEENQRRDYPFGWGEPCDVANFVAFLLSDAAKFLSGQKYVVDSGGML